MLGINYWGLLGIVIIRSGIYEPTSISWNLKYVFVAVPVGLTMVVISFDQIFGRQIAIFFRVDGEEVYCRFFGNDYKP